MTTADVERVHAKVDLTKRLRERFMATLHLDHRYLVIALALARESDDAGAPVLLPVSELTRLCESYWPAGFADVSNYEFRSLLTELVDLGVLRDKGTEFGIAGPHVRLMLGSPDEVKVALDDTDDLELPSGTISAAARPSIDDSCVSRLPLTEAQLHATTRTGTLCIVVGSAALDAGRVVEGLVEHARRYTRFRVRTTADIDSFVAALRDPVRGDGTDVVTVELVDAGERHIERIIETWETAPDRDHMAPVVVVRPHSGRGWRTAVEGEGRVDLVVLERWRRAGLSRALTELRELPPSPQKVASAFAATGGWPVLVGELLRRSAAADLDTAIDDVASSLADPGQAAAFLRQLALGADPRLKRAFAALAEYGGEGLDPDELAVLVDVDDPAEVGELLRLLGVAQVTSEGHLVAEPVAASAWMVAGEA